jgi:nucleoid DNA-binding protein
MSTSKASDNGKKFSAETYEKIKTYAFHADVVSFISKKANIKPALVIPILDLFVFIIKKILIEHGKIRIFSLGIIYTRVHKRKGIARSYTHIFKTANSLKRVLKGEKLPQFIEEYTPDLQKNFKLICRALNLQIEDVRYLFSLFIYCIILNLLKYKIYRLRRFGYFYVKEQPWVVKSGISKKWTTTTDRPINTKSIVFKHIDSGWKELNRKSMTIQVSQKLKRMFHLLRVSRSTFI